MLCTNLKISLGIPYMVWDTGIESYEAMTGVDGLERRCYLLGQGGMTGEEIDSAARQVK